MQTSLKGNLRRAVLLMLNEGFASYAEYLGARPDIIFSDFMTERAILARARPRAKSGRKFAIGQVFQYFIFAPTGNGLSFFRTATRSGFERCKKNSNPIINPVFYPIFRTVQACSFLRKP